MPIESHAPVVWKNWTLRRVQMLNLKALPPRDQKVTAENAGFAKGEMEPGVLKHRALFALSAGYEQHRNFPDADS